MTKTTFWEYITVENPLTIPLAVFILAFAVLSFIFSDGYEAGSIVGYCALALEAFFWMMMVRAYRKL